MCSKKTLNKDFFFVKVQQCMIDLLDYLVEL